MANVENPYQIALENNLIVTTYQQNKSAYTIRVKFGPGNYYASEAYNATHGTTSSRPVSGEILYNDSPYELHLFGNFSYGSDYNFSIAIDPSIRNNAKPLIIRAKNSSSQENIENFDYFAIIDTNFTIYDENDTYIEFRYSYGALSSSHAIPYDYQTFLRTRDRDCKFDEGTIIEFELSDYNFYEDKSIPYYYLTNKIDSDIFIDFQQIEIENIVTTSSNDYAIINNMIAFPNISNPDDFITVIDGKQYIDISSFAFTWGGASFLVDQNNIESITVKLKSNETFPDMTMMLKLDKYENFRGGMDSGISINTVREVSDSVITLTSSDFDFSTVDEVNKFLSVAGIFAECLSMNITFKK